MVATNGNNTSYSTRSMRIVTALSDKDTNHLITLVHLANIPTAQLDTEPLQTLDYPIGFYLKVKEQTMTRGRNKRNEYDCLH